MSPFPLHDLYQVLSTYGYWAVCVFIAIESTGIPFPGESMLLLAAIYGGTTHHLSIFLVIVAAASGAIVGDNLGFLAGREGGYRLLRRYGRSIRLDERKLKLGQYLFLKHGGKVVFFGRFVAVLPAWAAFLAGTNRMRWSRFLLFNALGGMAWATTVGLGGYFLGSAIHRLTGPVALISLVLASLFLMASFLFVRRNEQRLEAEAERALPGPLEAYQPQASKGDVRRGDVPLTLASQAATGPTPPAQNQPAATSESSQGRAVLEKVQLPEAEGVSISTPAFCTLKRRPCKNGCWLNTPIFTLFLSVIHPVTSRSLPGVLAPRASGSKCSVACRPFIAERLLFFAGGVGSRHPLAPTLHL